MRLIRSLLEPFQKLGPYSRLAIRLGSALMGIYYIVGIASRLSAPYVPNYHNAIALFHGCLEAAPASFAVGVCAGLLGDLMLRHGRKRDE